MTAKRKLLHVLDRRIEKATGERYWIGTENTGAPGERPRYHLADGLATSYSDAVNKAILRCAALGIDISDLTGQA